MSQRVRITEVGGSDDWYGEPGVVGLIGELSARDEWGLMTFKPEGPEEDLPEAVRDDMGLADFDVIYFVDIHYEVLHEETRPVGTSSSGHDTSSQPE